jgi:hypothetical protein
MTPPDDYAEVLVRDVCEATGRPEGQVRAICAELAGPALTDRGLQWELCQTWGLAWEEMRAIMSLGAGNLAAIGKGIAARSVAITGITQKKLMETLNAAAPDLDAAKALSAISKQQNDLARSWLADPAPQQHVHFHGSAEGIEMLRQYRQLRDSQKPTKERLLDQGVSPT